MLDGRAMNVTRFFIDVRKKGPIVSCREMDGPGLKEVDGNRLYRL